MSRSFHCPQIGETRIMKKGPRKSLDFFPEGFYNIGLGSSTLVCVENQTNFVIFIPGVSLESFPSSRQRICLLLFSTTKLECTCFELFF